MKKELGKAAFTEALYKLLGFVKQENYFGYDPYDALVSPYLAGIKHQSLRKWVIQMNKFSPLNLRPLLKIPRGLDIKGHAVFANAYLVLSRATNNRTYVEDSEHMLRFLLKHSLQGTYNDHCWSGHYFRTNTLDNSEPDIITTCMCGEAFLKHAALFGDKNSAMVARSAGRFIQNNLLAHHGRSYFFRYAPSKSEVHVFNATAIAAAFLSKLGDGAMCRIAKRCMDAVIREQNSDGSWDYSACLVNDRRRRQIDFHQGYILESIHEMTSSIEQKAGALREALDRGLSFYLRKQFTERGTSYWRYPLRWPIDIHNQAQGIVTLTKFRRYGANYFRHARRIATWTVLNMQDKKGYFYFQKWPAFSNKIPFMRWSQAWMALALAVLVEAMDEG